MAENITFIEGEFYPDTIDPAIEIYKPILESFGELLTSADDSCHLLKLISDIPNPKRTQLLRVFKKYVSPDTSVEMLKVKKKIPHICTSFGGKFRPLLRVREEYSSRPTPDEAIIAILNEYKDRGKKGYGLTGAFFQWFQATFTEFKISGPTGAGRDINLGKVLRGYPVARRPVDFIIKENAKILVIGLAHYDSDRGGSQEDDRPTGYRTVINEVLNYADSKRLNRLKVLLINDGPGLLLGSMCQDYCEIEDIRAGRVMVATLKMLKDRLTAEWIRS